MIARGETKWVFVESQSGRPMAIPRKFSRFLRWCHQASNPAMEPRWAELNAVYKPPLVLDGSMQNVVEVVLQRACRIR